MSEVSAAGLTASPNFSWSTWARDLVALVQFDAGRRRGPHDFGAALPKPGRGHRGAPGRRAVIAGAPGVPGFVDAVHRQGPFGPLGAALAGGRFSGSAARTSPFPGASPGPAGPPRAGAGSREYKRPPAESGPPPGPRCSSRTCRRSWRRSPWRSPTWAPPSARRAEAPPGRSF